MNSRGQEIVTGGLVLFICASIVVCCATLGLGPTEAIRVIGGLLLLWGPCAAFLFFLLKRDVPDTLSRFCLSVVGAYGLTTLIYFAVSVLKVPDTFGTVQWSIAVLAATQIRWSHLGKRLMARSSDRQMRINLLSRLGSFANARVARVNWVLAALIAASLLVNVRYQIPYEQSPITGERIFVQGADQTYYAGLAYELSRGIPPEQRSIKAGVPERAYHMFSHLTTMLIARYTVQRDMIRAELVYHYGIIEIMLCLMLFKLGQLLTGSKRAAYLCVSMAYLQSIVIPPVKGNQLGYLYFTWLPWATSSLETTVLTTPQTYSALLLLFGTLLAIASAFHRLSTRRVGSRPSPQTTEERGANEYPLTTLVLVCAILVAVMLRFRIQIFLPLASGMLLTFVFAFWKTSQKIYFVGGALLIVISALLYIEMLSPVYEPNTARLVIGNNNVTSMPRFNWMNSWPFADGVHATLNGLVSDRATAEWIWQCLSMTMFLLFNVVGLPTIFLVTVTVWQWRSKTEGRLFVWFSVWLVFASLVGAITLSTTYDPYSVGGQMLLLPGWYLLPLEGIGAWWALRNIRSRMTWRLNERVLGAAAVGIALLAQMVLPESILSYELHVAGMPISDVEQEALLYLRDRTPQDAVIITDRHVDRAWAVISGIAGRRAYYEYTYSDQLWGIGDANENRAEVVRSLWNEKSPQQFCTELRNTGATYLVEYSTHPISAPNPDCLSTAWSAPQQDTGKSESPEGIRILMYTHFTMPASDSMGGRYRPSAARTWHSGHSQ